MTYLRHSEEKAQDAVLLSTAASQFLLYNKPITKHVTINTSSQNSHSVKSA